MTFVDKGQLEILTWDRVRNEVKLVDPQFTKLVDELSPSDEHFFVKCTYPYGTHVLKNAVLMIPSGKDGKLIPLTDSSVSPKLKKSLDYNLNSNPVSLILKNSFEIYLPLTDRTIPLNGVMLPGTTFGTFRILNPETSYQPKFIWEMTAGARSMFMLPKITEVKRHRLLKKKFNLSMEVPTNLMAHWPVFKELSQYTDPWEAEILFFSKKWFEHLEDKAWFSFYYHFHRSLWGGTEFWRNQPIWNLIFSLILKDYEAKPSAYVCDMVKYLLHVAIGAQPGFAPARDNTVGPIGGLQKIYQEEYGIRNYPPIIMCPARFNMRDPNSPSVYYSLQYPTAIEFGKSSRKRTSLISDLHDIRSLLIRYLKKIKTNQFQTEGTPIHDLITLVNFDYFHNNVELHSGMINSREMAKGDEGLLTTLDGIKHDKFPDMCSFVKGCIRISHKDGASL